MCIAGRTGGGTGVRCALANCVRSRGGTLRIGTASGRGCVDTCAATRTGALTARARSIASGILGDASPVTVLRGARRTSGNTSSAIAGYRATGGGFASGGAFCQSACGECAVANADVSAVVVAGGTADRACTALAEGRAVRIGGTIGTLDATGGGITVS